MSTTTVIFPGREITLGGRQFVLPALSFGAFERLRKELEQIAASQTFDPLQMQGAVTNVIFEALRRNYPELERSDLVDWLDWDCAMQHVEAVMELSMPKARSGETTAASPSGESTGPA